MRLAKQTSIPIKLWRRRHSSRAELPTFSDREAARGLSRRFGPPSMTSGLPLCADTVSLRTGSAKQQHCLSPGSAAANALGRNALPIQKIDLLEGPAWFIEEQHEA